MIYDRADPSGFDLAYRRSVNRKSEMAETP